MAYLPNAQACKNNCGAMIYFDKNSTVGHPETDKWIPLIYIEDTGVYTGEPHNCPNRPKYGNGNHRQQSQQSQQQQTQQQQQLASQKPIWNIVNLKLDRIIMLLEKERQ